MSGPLRRSITTALGSAVNDRPVIAFVPKAADASHWEQLLNDAGANDVLVIALDHGTYDQRIRPRRPITGSTGHLAFHHEIIGNLTGSAPADPAIETFDPQHRALVIAPDPLDPPATGGRELLGAKTPAARLLEHKTIIDSLWDIAGVHRVDALVCDLTPRLPSVMATMDAGSGVVLSCQQRGAGPQAGGEGIWWTQDGTLPASFPKLDSNDMRIRIMPLLLGLPCRIHGITVGAQITAFPPMELLSLPRAVSGTFLWAGAVPAHTLSGSVRADLDAVAVTVGTWLHALGHHGAFAIDGILTDDGYRPTELTTRLTSAFEGADPGQRILLHAANLLARAGHHLGSPSELAELAEAAVRDRFDVYGASPTAATSGNRSLHWISAGPSTTHERQADGTLTLGPSPRGWLLHARLSPSALPRHQPVGLLAPRVFELSDAIFGTAFGELTPSFGLTTNAVTALHDARRPCHVMAP